MARTSSPAFAPQSKSLDDASFFMPNGPEIFWALDGTLDHCSKAERKSPIVESSLSVIVVLDLPCVTSNVNIVNVGNEFPRRNLSLLPPVQKQRAEPSGLRLVQQPLRLGLNIKS